MAITVELTPEIEARLIAQAQAQGITAEAYLQAAIENLLNSQPQVYKVGTALVVESKPISNLENCIEQERESRISNIIADYESSV
ncbi:MAG: CopG family transcriptional regulator [Cyanobacteria bacterium J06621_8]